ncbi:hypothetical protein RV11_GL000790 [Enterococcus phoeniculicola]|jgi:PTS system mannose-specific IIC component|uniref:PTS system mannose/fructose/sorbose-specific IIC component n=1 Tax=Enterococcus phoeniculicola ATCC BAA-412 TaxID=1158610 RepID=R3TVU5_9ENTE|nr:PTS sugar transporter subunit IIC [Enterococcus phoeniculicola]EOL45273.1 hypothetical protein UC3_01163 [Enterococcus phoeniculicola ATCC BAA-412]EOT74635.1 hypothetical protein I589_02235 [Enterococcus phoeniculicola ATCC BAA-412]OJG70906.1 hypothetical protein RV11_GL000790 [Enterococcus phoeniculicola]
MLQSAILVALWAGICSLDDKGPQLGFRRPLPAGAIVGLLMGDLGQGLVIGATLELMWMGVGNVGAYNSPDVVTGAIVGTAMGISTGGGVAAGVAIAVPASILCQQLLVLWNTAASFLVHRADVAAEEGDFKKIGRIHYLSVPFLFLIRAVPVFIAVYLGSNAVEKVIDALPDSIMTGLSTASALIPAVGIAMLLTMMLKGRMWVFLLLGFTLVSYLNLPLLAVSFIGVVMAALYDLASQKPEVVVVEANSESDEGSYDL